MQQVAGSHLTTTEAASYLGVSAETVRRWAADRRLRHVVTPTGRLRFAQTDLNAALATVEAEPRPDPRSAATAVVANVAAVPA